MDGILRAQTLTFNAACMNRNMAAEVNLSWLKKERTGTPCIHVDSYAGTGRVERRYGGGFTDVRSLYGGYVFFERVMSINVTQGACKLERQMTISSRAFAAWTFTSGWERNLTQRPQPLRGRSHTIPHADIQQFDRRRDGMRCDVFIIVLLESSTEK